jgi:dTDP-glucose 4,6-dehydratase
MKNTLVTGGCGFIGSHFIDHLLQSSSTRSVVNVDAMLTGSNADMLHREDARYIFKLADVREADFVSLFEEHQIDTVVHFAAQTHVDRSIVSPREFFDVNVNGTLHLLESMRACAHKIRLVHISTDEVFGSTDTICNEDSKMNPSNPYAASKASSDLAVFAYAQTFGTDVVVVNMTNNFGPRQNEEKLIPKTIARIMRGERVPIYGDGMQRRDWLFVADAVRAINIVAICGRRGERYCVSTGIERTNLEVVSLISEIIAEQTRSEIALQDVIEHVEDRAAHDRHYRISSAKIRNELDWRASTMTFRRAIALTVDDALCSRADARLMSRTRDHTANVVESV